MNELEAGTLHVTMHSILTAAKISPPLRSNAR